MRAHCSAARCSAARCCSVPYVQYNLQMSLTIGCGIHMDIHPARSASPTHCQTVIPPFPQVSLPPLSVPAFTPCWKYHPSIPTDGQKMSIFCRRQKIDRRQKMGRQKTDAHPIGGTRFPHLHLRCLVCHPGRRSQRSRRTGAGWAGRGRGCREGGVKGVRCGKSGGWGWGWGWMVWPCVCRVGAGGG